MEIESLLQRMGLARKKTITFDVEMGNYHPGVPGVIYKIYPENEELRKLEQARDLWKTVSEITGRPIKEIYTGKDIPLDALSLDHFVPRSYISNDELWNLTPMRRSLNSSKNTVY